MTAGTAEESPGKRARGRGKHARSARRATRKSRRSADAGIASAADDTATEAVVDAEHEGYLDYTELAIAAKRRRKSFRELGRLLKSSFGLSWISGRGTFVLTTTLQLISGLVIAAQVLVVKEVLDALLAIEGQGKAATHAIPSVLLLAAVTSISTVSAAVLVQQQRLLGELVTRSTWQKVLEVAGAVSLRSFETSEFYDRLDRVETNAVRRPYTLTQGMIGMIGGGAGTLGVAAALIALHPLLLPLLLLAGVPLWVTGRMQGRLEFNFVVSQTPRNRLRNYLEWVLVDRDAAKELRAFGFGKALHRRWDAVYAAYVRDLRRHVRRRGVLAFAGAVISATVLGTTLGVLVWLVARGDVTLAEAGAAIVAIRMMSSQLTSLFGGAQQIFESGLFLEDLHDFFDLAPKARLEESGANAPASFSAIEVRGLSFTYPGTATPALHDVSLDIKAGEVVALVGENGSGKTTLAKLLATLYEPDTGAVAWDGIDIRGYDRAQLRKAIAVIFQDFMRYELTARENIAAGRPDALGAPGLDEAIMAAATQAGADRYLSALPKGLSTILSKEYKNGRDLSLGQWQRVALARAFFRDAPFVILDEPSSALDPRAEYELFAHIRELLAGRTVLFISHRFSTVRNADRIYVMKDGRIAEHGNHDELMACGGLYADLFTLQAQAYLDPADRA